MRNLNLAAIVAPAPGLIQATRSTLGFGLLGALLCGALLGWADTPVDVRYFGLVAGLGVGLRFAFIAPRA